MSETTEPVPAVDLSTLTRAELADIALSKYGMTIKGGDSKADILAAVVAESTKAKYRVKRPMRDGKRYGIGAIVTLTAAAAAPLLRTQVIEVATETVPL